MQHRMRKMAVATLVAIGAVVVSDATLADAEPAANSGSSHFDPRLPIMPGTQLRATKLPAADPYAVGFWGRFQSMGQSAPCEFCTPIARIRAMFRKSIEQDSRHVRVVAITARPFGVGCIVLGVADP